MRDSLLLINWILLIKNSELMRLSAGDYALRCFLQDKLNNVQREEKTNWSKHDKENDLPEGDKKIAIL